jgi:hypothetical protein
MKWIRERDALIAQTLAFVQSVTGRTEGLPRPGAPAAMPGVPPEIVSARTVEVPREIGQPAQTAVPPPRTTGDFRSEIQARVANFRKHQERFEREREEYCAATLTRLRDAIRDASPRFPTGK